MKYEPSEFKVVLTWFTESGVAKRKFTKYKDAVQWAENNLDTDEIIVKIYGTLKRSFTNNEQQDN